MKARYAALYRPIGVNGLPDGLDVDLIRDDRAGIHAYLTMKTQPWIALLDIHAAVGISVLSALTGSLPGDTPQARDQSAVALVAQRKSGADPSGALMVVEVDGDVAHQGLEKLVDLPDYSFGLNIFDDHELVTKGNSAFDRAMAGLALALDEHLTTSSQKMGAVSYLIEEKTGRRIFTRSLSASGTLSAMSDLSQKAASAATRYVSALNSADKSLESVIHLLSLSLDDKADTLRSFLATWAALEILVNKGFQTYERGFFVTLKANAQDAATPLIEQFQSVMKSKYRLMDKFTMMATALDPTAAKDDAETFKGIKDNRDRFFHAMKTDPNSLPVDSARRLLRKYLRLHLNRPTS
jgi:hypothetical protein